MKITSITAMLLLATPSIMAQADWHDSDSLIKAEPTKGLAYKVESQFARQDQRLHKGSH